MTQKVLKVGTSAAVTIPKKSLHALGLKIGDRVTLTIDEKNKRVIIASLIRIDKELFTWTKKFIKQYQQALEVLAKK